MKLQTNTKGKVIETQHCLTPQTANGIPVHVHICNDKKQYENIQAFMEMPLKHPVKVIPQGTKLQKVIDAEPDSAAPSHMQGAKEFIG
jgi:hypothetical protein